MNTPGRTAIQGPGKGEDVKRVTALSEIVPVTQAAELRPVASRL